MQQKAANRMKALFILTTFLMIAVYLLGQNASTAVSIQVDGYAYVTSSSAGLAIRNDPTGGDCTLVGNWDPSVKKCTLTTDIEVGVPSGNGITISDNGITLDGNSHQITGSNTASGFGVGLYQINGATVKNLNINTFGYGVLAEYPSNSNSITGNGLTMCSNGIFVGGENNVIEGNIAGATVSYGIRLENGGLNIISGNTLGGDMFGVYASYSHGNAIVNNTFQVPDSAYQPVGLELSNSDYNLTIRNSFTKGPAILSYLARDEGSNNVFDVPEPVGGNYWGTFDTPSEGCNNADGDSFCDAAYSVYGVTDNLPWTTSHGWPDEQLVTPDVNHFWTWYDASTMKNWVLVANPAGAPQNLRFILDIGGSRMALGNNFGLGEGAVPAGNTHTASYPGLMAGPVKVATDEKEAIVSQRSLMGNSFEEVLGTDESKLSDHFYWTWYDQRSPGYANWILVANPSDTETVHAVINFTNIDGTPVSAESDIGPGQNWTPTFPGKMGGPVELNAYHEEVTSCPFPPCTPSYTHTKRNVMASQRVLSNFGTAFNEVPGIPASELYSSYLWTWYDMSSPGYADWILIANPGDTPVDYQIKIGGQPQPQQLGGSGTIAPHSRVTPVFPGTINGPVEVTASGKVIASQRVIAGPSFEEVPGYPSVTLSNEYHWTWYDMNSAGSSNWVLIANPGDTAVSYQVAIAGQVMGGGLIPAHDKVTPVFPGIMNGPVEVAASGPVMSSQRVTWNGYFNEVLGTVLN